MELAGKKTLVIGAGRSGVAASRFLASKGAVVALTDRKPFEEWNPEARELREQGIGCLPGEIPAWLLDQIELIVISPGVPPGVIPVRYAERAGAEVIGEIELAARFLRGRIVAITGSNGKTTTTALTGAILGEGGLKTQVGGNIGSPLIAMAADSEEEGWTVAELSSFQLETIRTFHPNIAIVLNVTPNHMDRYDSFMDYAAAKHRIFMNQGPGDCAILNADDPVVFSWAEGLKAHKVFFSTTRELDEGLFLRGRDLVSRSGESECVLTTRDEIGLRGLHNVENVLAAMAAGLACGVAPESMRETAARFLPVEHRLEFVAEIGGVRFVNDSKATSVDAAVKALEAFADERGKVVLILGGRGKKAPYAPLADLIRDCVRRMILLGEDAPVIEREIGTAAQYEMAQTMCDAVGRAFASAERGDVVLLAPACASFDMFDSYEHRGRVFKEEVGKLSEQMAA